MSAYYGYTRPYRAAPSGGPTVVYHCGDSICHGAYPIPDGLGGWTYLYQGGWRSAVFAAMTAAGMAPNFVGPVLNSSETPPVTTAGTGHAGFNGSSGHNWYLSYWATYQPGLSATPNIITLSFGTNDTDSAAAATDFCRVIDLAAANYPFANILVATRPPTATPGEGATQATQVRVEVAVRKALGMHVDLVDIYADSGLVSADLPDTVHPNPTGYAKMADVWNRSILRLV